MKPHPISKDFSVASIMLIIAFALMSARAALLPAPALNSSANAARNVSTSPTFSGTLEIFFQDSRTAMGVVPDRVLLDGTNVAKQVDLSGRLRLDVFPGEYGIVVSAKSYDELGTRQTIFANETNKSIILLDPTTTTTNSAEPIAEARGAIGEGARAAIRGYVVDDETGQPLAGATLAVIGTNNPTVTDARGFFSLTVPVSDGTPIPEDNAGRFFVKKDMAVTKAGYGTVEELNIVLIGGETYRFRFSLVPNGSVRVINEQEHRGNVQATAFDGRPAATDAATATLAAATPQASANGLASCSIRVGRTGCSSSPGACSTVMTMSIETYVKHVLPAEWFSSWNAESLKAGAVAVRSYGAYYVNNPISPSSSPAYDICDSTYCQVYGDTTATSTDSAVDATAGIYLVDGTGNIARTEYAAENNDSANVAGCGNCYTQNKPGDGICLSDSVCCGFTQNGHGRGMCQWGSQRWALNQGKTYTWILSHYYDAYGYTLQTLTCGATLLPDLTISGAVSVSPTSVSPGGTVRVDWTEKNIGTAASTTAHNTKIFLSASTYGTTYQIGYYGPMSTLGVGASSSYYGDIVVPATIPVGNYYVTAFVDCDQTVAEGSNEGNNIGSSTPVMLSITPVNISVTVQPGVSGASFTVDGTLYTAAQVFNWIPGNNHTIATASPQSGGTGIQYAWSGWSDGGAISHIVAPTVNGTTYTANFTTQYYLTTGYGSGGSGVSPNSGWYNSGTGVGLSATPASGYSFSSWTGSGTGSYSGSSPTPTITMNAPIFEGANFIVNPPDTTPPALTIVSPANGAVVTNASLPVSGTASDSGLGDNGISSVTVNGVIAGGGTAIGNGTANWSATVTLSSGPNTIAAVANDSYINSTTKQISVTYNPPRPVFGGSSVTGGQLQVNLSGLSVGETIAFYSSTDLKNWTLIQTKVASGPTLTFTTPINSGVKGQYIRAVVQ